MLCNNGHLYTKLIRHFCTKHRGDRLVQKALSSDTENRLAIFREMRKDGLLKYNLKNAVNAGCPAVRQRTSAKNEPLIVCGLCYGLYGKKPIDRHSKICTATCQTLSFPFNANDEKTDIVIGKNLKPDVVSLFSGSNTDIDKICRTDVGLILVRQKMLDSLEETPEVSNEEVMKSVFADVQLLAQLLIRFAHKLCRLKNRHVEDIQFTDMFQLCNFYILQLTVLSSNTCDGQYQSPSAKRSLYDLIQRAAKILQDLCNANEYSNTAAELSKFISLVTLSRAVSLQDSDSDSIDNDNSCMEKTKEEAVGHQGYCYICYMRVGLNSY